MNITLLKLGGSLITDKSKPYTAKPEIIRKVFLEIKEALQKKPDLNLIIGHGAGSFAHQSAKKYKTIDGFKNEKGKFGACFVHADAMKLHEIVLTESMKLGLPIFSLQPASFLMTKNKKINHMNFEILETVLKKKMIPMIFGDVIIDTQIGATIYSTDKIFSVLVDYFLNKNSTINQIIHAGNYDGVYDQDGKVIKKITKENYSQVLKKIKQSNNIDVTGSMQGKISEAMNNAKKGVKTMLLNGARTYNITSTLLKKKVISTTII